MSEDKLIHVLFVCSMNERRSLTGETAFADKDGLAVRSAGTVRGARRTLSADDIAWANLILVMEARHKERVLSRFGDELGETPLHVLDVPDIYPFMDEKLVALLNERAGPLIWPARR